MSTATGTCSASVSWYMCWHCITVEQHCALRHSLQLPQAKTRCNSNLACSALRILPFVLFFVIAAPGFGGPECKPCPVGTFSPGGSLYDHEEARPLCKRCPDNTQGSQTEGATSVAQCGGCNPGFGGLHCDLCPPGSWSAGLFFFLFGLPKNLSDLYLYTLPSSAARTTTHPCMGIDTAASLAAQLIPYQAEGCMCMCICLCFAAPAKLHNLYVIAVRFLSQPGVRICFWLCRWHLRRLQEVWPQPSVSPWILQRRLLFLQGGDHHVIDML